MPMPTIPGIPPETWEQILQILSQLNTSVVELGEQGITTFEQLRQWLMLQGYELVEISEVVGYTIAKTEAVDPATTNAVANRVATDIVATGGAGTAVTQFVTGGNRTLGLVPKAIAVGACLSLLLQTIAAGAVVEDVQEDLITSADPYTIDGENVPVLIDENGKTHFLEEMVESIRAKAIELGVFATDDEPEPLPAGNFTPTSNYLTFQQWYTVFANTWKIGANDPFDRFSVPLFGYYDLIVEWFNTNNLNIDDYVYVGTAGQSSGYIYMFKKNTQFAIRSLTDAGGVYYYLDTVEATSNSYYNAISVNKTIIPFALEHQNDVAKISVLSYTNFRPSSNASIPNAGANPTYDKNGLVTDFGTPTTKTNPNTSLGEKWASVHYRSFNVTPGGGVEGLTPAQDLIEAGVADATKPLTEVLPQLATGQMSIASPTENDLTHKSNWYPVSINSEDVFTDGATEEETSTATDGDVKEDLQPAILDAINELIKQINPDGTPDIPVSDSGDTPPENPPLTPGSGANGSNGLWAIYNPTLTQVQEFGAWLWSDSLADQFKRIFNSPIDGVIGFHMLYCTPSRGADQTIKCGFLASPVSSRTVSSPYVEINCGTVNIGEFYRNALDYDYTRISVYLPFIGIVPLDTNVVMGSDLNITYRVDVLTGTCLAQIKVIKENSDAVMYAFEGNCAVQIPLTATTYTGMVGALMSGVSAGIGVMTGNIAQAVTSGANALANMVSGKAGVKQSGTMGANAGALGIRKPYVIITHPIAYMPVDFNKLEGLPSNITATLGSLTGFTRVRSVHLENIGTATQEEINMIEELLKEGVII